MEEMKDRVLKAIFDPTQFSYDQPTLYNNGEEIQKRVMDRKEEEKIIYDEVFSALQDDLIKMGVDINYSTKLIIGEVTMNLVLIGRIKLFLLERPIMESVEKIKPDRITKGQIYSRDKLISYDRIWEGEKLNPVLNELLPKLEKKVNEGLKMLGLLPEQQLERQKIIISKTLKQKLVDLQNREVDYSIKNIKQIG